MSQLLMAIVHDIDFYIRTERGKVLEIASDTQPLTVADILPVPDAYVKYFLLLNLPLQASEADSATTAELRAFFREFARLEKVVEVNFDQEMARFVRRAIIPVGMEDFVGCISELDPSFIDLAHYRGYFGYSQTYSLYKSMIKRIFGRGFSHREIGLVMLLLDNETMCFKRLLPIFTRLTAYVTHNILDKNIVACCIALRATLTYIPGTMRGKDQYVVSLISYLTGVVSRHTSFVFINESDAEEIISTIDLLTRFPFETDVSRVSSGMLKEIVFRLESLAGGRMALYEEAFAGMCILETIPSICHLIGGCVDNNLSGAYSLIQKLALPQADHVPTDDWNGVGTRFLVAKYRSLEALYEWRADFDRVVFYRDIGCAVHPSRVLRVLGNLKRDVSWSDMIVFACHPGSQEEWLSFLFDGLFMGAPEHLVYIELFIESIRDRPDLLLYSGYLLLKSFEEIGAEKKWHILVDLFLRDIQSSDQRIVRLRCIVSEYVCRLEPGDRRSAFLQAFVERASKDFVLFNRRIIALLHALLEGGGEMPLETSRAIFLYLRQCAVSEWGKKETSRDLETMYVCAASKAIVQSGMEVDFDGQDTHLEKYYGLLTFCIARLEGGLFEEYVKTVKEKMLYFLFDADRDQVLELGRLMKKERSRFVDKFRDLYGGGE